jgi:hypothetical protein
MDCSRSLSTPNACPPKAPQRTGWRWTVNFNRLTLVTLVIAVAGFAGTAFAAGASEAVVQAAPLAGASH